MTRSELKTRVADACIDPFQANDLTPITLTQAESWLQDVFRDQILAELEPDERIPKDTTPAAFMEAWNALCVEHTPAAKEEKAMFTLLKTGAKVEITPDKKGTENYTATTFWMDKNGTLWADSPALGRFRRDDMNEQIFTAHLEKMLNMGFKLILHT